MEQADEKFLDKTNGKTVFTVDLAKKFGFKEDYDSDGSVNEARYEGSRQYKQMMLSTLPQYDIETELPKYSDTNNEGFADLFKGAKQR